MSQLKLLRRRGFSALFWTQFFGAFNDNLFKNALVILVVYQSASVWGLDTDQLVSVSGAVFILPFFLFSALAGQLADRFRKSSLIHWVKGAEIAIMTLAVAGFLGHRLELLFVVLFLMGCHSSVFGPVKYSILPQLVEEDELVGGNALVEGGTFLAILLGTIGGGVLIARESSGPASVSIAVIAIALAGFACSWLLPRTAAENPSLRISLNPFGTILETYRVTVENRAVFLSVLGASWFWFFGAVILAVLPIYTKDVLRADEHVITLFLALFCAGIGAGSLLCERLSGQRLELGLVPFGSIGMSVFAADLFFAGVPPAAAGAPGDLLGIGGFLAATGSWRIVADLVLLSVFSGFFIVPLNTMIQQRSAPAERSRVVAGGNILSSLFMVLASAMLVGLFAVGASVPQIFLVLGVMNAAASIYIYHLLPEFLLRFVAWILTNCVYRLRTVGRDNVPLDGPALLTSNHVSFVDWMIIASACKRPPRFVMYHGFLKIPLLGWFFRDAKVIPISPAREDAQVTTAAFDRIAAELAAGELVCIFPEGALTPDGQLQRFRPGVERIVQRTPVPVVPIALVGMWGSFFSRKGGAAMRRPFRRVWSKIQLVIGPPMAPEQVTAAALAARVASLGGFTPPPASEPPASTVTAVILAAGAGSRLAELGRQHSKAMVPVAGKPLIEWVMVALRAGGVGRFVIVRHPSDDELADFLRQMYPDSIVIDQAVRSGIGDALACARDSVAGEAAYLACACDSVFPPADIARLVAAGQRYRDSAAVGVLDLGVEATRTRSAVQVSGARVTAVLEKPPAGTSDSPLVAAPLYWLPRQFGPYLDHAAAVGGERHVTTALAGFIRDGGVVFAVPLSRRIEVTTAADVSHAADAIATLVG